MPKPKKFVFVLMPFDKSFNDIYAYGIKQTCTTLNTYCERVDEQIFSERILDRIYNQIAKADIVVADMTNRNANVFYEVGYAHGLGKSVILLTQKADDIPFDLKHFPHIVYNGQIKELAEQLKTRLEWFLNEEIIEEVSNFEFGLEFILNGLKITDGQNIDITEEYRHPWDDSYGLKIEVYNSAQKFYKSKFKIGLETSAINKDLVTGLEIIIPSQETVMFVSKEISNIYPNAFKSIPFTLKQPNSDSGKSIKFDFKLKVFTILELREINFAITVPSKATNPFPGW